MNLFFYSCNVTISTGLLFSLLDRATVFIFFAYNNDPCCEDRKAVGRACEQIIYGLMQNSRILKTCPDEIKKSKDDLTINGSEYFSICAGKLYDEIMEAIDYFCDEEQNENYEEYVAAKITKLYLENPCKFTTSKEAVR